MTGWSRAASGRRERARCSDYRLRFGLSADAVRPLFGAFPGPGPGAGTPGHRPLAVVGPDVVPDALAVYEPGLSRGQRMVARLGTSRTVTVGLRPQPVSAKGLVAVAVGGVAGMMLAEPFDTVTFMAPLYGLVVGTAGGAVGWRAVKGRRATTIVVEQWRPQLDTICRILSNADRLGQPFASPPALRVALHSALWHAVTAVGQPGDSDIVAAFDEHLTALRQATDATLAELESPSIAARRAAVTERLAAAMGDLELPPLMDLRDMATGDDLR